MSFFKVTVFDKDTEMIINTDAVDTITATKDGVEILFKGDEFSLKVDGPLRKITRQINKGEADE